MKAEAIYIDLYRQHKEMICLHSAPVMNALREDALADFKTLGFPTTTSEAYRHTDVARAFAPDYGLNLNRLSIPAHPGNPFRCDVPNIGTALYFVVNDTCYEGKVSARGLPQGVYAGSMKAFMEQHPDTAARYYGQAAPTKNDPIAALNTLLVQDGFVLYVPKNTVLEQPVQLINIFRSNVDTMANRRILIILEPHAQAKLLVCDHSADGVKFLSTQVVEVFAGAGSCFDYYDLEESSPATTRFSSLYVEQDAASNVLINGITLNNGLTRNNYRIRLNGPKAESILGGIGILNRRQCLDTHSLIVYAAPDCTSTELFKHVLDDHSVGSFCGRILVEKGARQTVARQTNRNLCLTPQARMYSQPQLEIYADDVTCSHGMSTGQLDQQAVFYLQARGISKEEARLLLSIAFTADVIRLVRLDTLKHHLVRLIEKYFRGEQALCAGCTICH